MVTQLVPCYWLYGQNTYLFVLVKWTDNLSPLIVLWADILSVLHGYVDRQPVPSYLLCGQKICHFLLVIWTDNLSLLLGYIDTKSVPSYWLGGHTTSPFLLIYEQTTCPVLSVIWTHNLTLLIGNRNTQPVRA